MFQAFIVYCALSAEPSTQKCTLSVAPGDLFSDEDKCIEYLAETANVFNSVKPNSVYIYNLGCKNYMKDSLQKTSLNK